MSTNFDGFVPIHTLFYTLFHPTEGSKVRFQFPPNSMQNGGIDFDTIKNYIIPKPQLCNKLLTFKYGNYRLVCYPVNVNSRFYSRNSFTFNFVFVFPYDCATLPYEPAITRLGKMFKVLEEQSQILSKAEQDPVYFQLKTKDSGSSDQNADMGSLAHSEHTDLKFGGDDIERYQEIMKDLSKGHERLNIEDILTKLYLDLNNYSECLIPIDDGNSIDIKLFPVRKPPSSNISIEDVPVAIVNLSNIIDVNWDPTMIKIVPFINGINSIVQIASYAKSDVELVQECIKHLLYYRCVILSDIFQFSNIYAPSSEIHVFLTNPLIAKSCQLFVQTESNKHQALSFDSKPNSIYPTGKKQNSNGTVRSRRMNSNGGSISSSLNSARENRKDFSTTSSYSFFYKARATENESFGASEQHRKRVLPRKSCLFDLYRSLSQGRTVREWYKQNFEIIRDNNIDVRRFIMFGTTRRLIYRVNSYPVLKNTLSLNSLESISSKEPKVSATGFNSKNIFSAADIRVVDTKDDEKDDTTMDAADLLLNNIYQKLSSKHDGSSNTKRNTHHHDGSTNITSGSTSRKSSSDSPHKVSFNFGITGQPHLVQNSTNLTEAEHIEAWTRRREEDVVLLEAVRKVENFDNICTKLHKSRADVEKMLKGLDQYHIINS